MKSSEVMGVHYLKGSNTWIAKDVHKKTLYRGKDMFEAENIRRAYDIERGKETRKSSIRGATCYNNKTPFNSVFQPDWYLSPLMTMNNADWYYEQ